MSQTNPPSSSPMETPAPVSGAASLPVSGKQAAAQTAADSAGLEPEIDEISIGGHQNAAPAAQGQAEKQAVVTPDLGAQKNALIKTARIVTQDWASTSGFAHPEHFWGQLDNEVSGIYLGCYMYPNVQTVHVTFSGLPEVFLPAGVPNRFAVRYHTDSGTVYIAAAEGGEHDEQQQPYELADAAGDGDGDGAKRELVVRVDINPVAGAGDHNELDWAPVLVKEAIESEDAYLDSPEFQHRLVWEMTQMAVEESLWKPSARSHPIVVGNLELVSASTDAD